VSSHVDRDWVRAKTEPAELFKEKTCACVRDGTKPQACSPPPLWGYFEALASKPGMKASTLNL